MISAMDYYYTIIAPEESRQNYQQLHQKHIHEDNIDILSHKPCRSNDILIEDYINEIINNASRDISEKLENVFIAKRKNFFPNAGAIHDKDTYSGDLIFFYVGLSDVLFQFAILFTQFINLSSLRRNFKDDDPKIKDAFIKLCVDIEILSEAQIDWGINQNEIRFKENFLYPDKDIIEKSVGVATLMDKSILRHEISHHLLGHTKSSNKISFDIINDVLNNINCTHNHKKELEADLLAIYLPLTKPNLSQNNIEQFSIDIALGTLLMQTALSQLKTNILDESETHPSWYLRYNTSLKFIKKLYQSKYLDSIINDITKFQVLLYTVQNKGLGSLNIEILNDIPNKTEK